MKYTTLFALLFLLVATASADHRFQDLEGVYHNRHTVILVDSYSKGLRIKGVDIRRPNRWIKFRQFNINKFEDRYGNVIKIQQEGWSVRPVIKFEDRRGYITYFTRPHYNSVGCSTGYKNGPTEHRFKDEDRRSKDLNSRDFSIEGTYRSSTGEQIAIVTTRSGFKAKFTGEKRWKKYTKQGGSFLDDDGNQYQIESTDSLIWKGKYSGKTVRIEKISDEVMY